MCRLVLCPGGWIEAHETHYFVDSISFVRLHRRARAKHLDKDRHQLYIVERQQSRLRRGRDQLHVAAEFRLAARIETYRAVPPLDGRSRPIAELPKRPQR